MFSCVIIVRVVDVLVGVGLIMGVYISIYIILIYYNSNNNISDIMTILPHNLYT